MQKRETPKDKVSVKKVFNTIPVGENITVQGWVKNKRVSKNVLFITLQDGSSFQALQIVANPSRFEDSLIKKITIGSSLLITGKVVTSLGREQAKEVEAATLSLLGSAPEDYPLQPKWHSLSFLRTIQHLRVRTNTFNAIFRIRHALAYAIHTFFHERGFYWLHTPIITNVDAEGAGEVFGITSRSDSKNDPNAFFGKEMFLTVSGQLAGEVGITGLGKVYAFGPTFRAENSNTTRHLAEFWMVEPEMAFYDLEDTIALAKALIRHAIAYVLTESAEEIAFLEQRQLKAAKKKQKTVVALRTKLKALLNNKFSHITYTDAITLLKEVTSAQPNLFKYPVTSWGGALQTEHEHYLTHHFKGGVIVTDYPKDVKAFYMRQNEDGKTVAAMDLLLPGIGEVVGGAQREERLAYLESAMVRVGIDKKKMDWYLDTRRFGTIPHSGFGLGFERMVAFTTGMENVRDVIFFPRTPGQAMG